MGNDKLLSCVEDLAEYPSVKMLNKMIQLSDPNSGLTNDQLNDEAYTKRAGTICDQNAYLIMCMASSFGRVEIMKTQANLLTKAQTLKEGSWTDTSGTQDHVHLLKRHSGKTLLTLMETWSKLDGQGVVQLKFAVDAAAHTFVVHRWGLEASESPTGQKETFFLVYQSYEGVYRLADHLNISSYDETIQYLYGASSSISSPTSSGTLWSSTGLLTQLNQLKTKYDEDTTNNYKQGAAYLSLLNDKQIPYVKTEWSNFTSMRERNGELTPLSWEELKERVLTPLSNLLDLGVRASEYALVSGAPVHGKPDKQVYIPWFLMLMSDYIQAPFSDYADLMGLMDYFTQYVYCPQYDNE